MMVSRLRASLEARRGSAVFTTMLTGTDPLLAAPRQGQRGSSQVIRRLHHSITCILFNSFSGEILPTTHFSAIARMTPSLPRGGGNPRGKSPLYPQFFFQMRGYCHAPRGEGRQTPSARGSITIQNCPLQVFSRAKKSDYQ